VVSSTPQGSSSFCGAGAGGALMVSSIGLCGLIALRRRR